MRLCFTNSKDAWGWEACPSPCGVAMRRPGGEKGSPSSSCSEPVEMDLPTLPKGTDQSQTAGLCPDRGHRTRTTPGALVPRSNPKKIHLSITCSGFLGCWPGCTQPSASSMGPAGTLLPSALTLSGERGAQGLQDRGEEAADLPGLDLEPWSLG